MCILFNVKKLMGIVDKSISRNEDEWNDKNANYQIFFFSAINNKLMKRLVNCHTFNKMWH
jgi:hypothetical protein